MRKYYCDPLSHGLHRERRVVAGVRSLLTVGDLWQAYWAYRWARSRVLYPRAWEALFEAYEATLGRKA